MKKFLENLIKQKQDEATSIRSKIEESQDVNEVRALGDTLQKVLDELNDAKAQLDKLDEDKGEDNGAAKQQDNGDQGAARSFNPIATYGTQKRDANAGTTDSMEYRTAFMNYVLRNKPISAQARENANTTTTDAASVIPSVLVNRIVERMDECGMILPLVNHTSFAAGVVVPTSSVKPVATWVAEGATSDRQKKTTGKITFSYFKLRCEISMSMEVGTMALSAFETAFVKNVADAMVIAREKAIIAGTGEGQPTGILQGDAGKAVQIAAAVPTYKELVSIESEVPAAYESSAKWCMTKKQFGNFLSATDTNGQPIARVNYGISGKPERSILGREVVIHPYATEMGSNVAFIFDFDDYVENTIYDMGITKKQDWDTEDLLTKAVMSVDGKPVSTDSLIRVTVKG